MLWEPFESRNLPYLLSSDQAFHIKHCYTINLKRVTTSIHERGSAELLERDVSHFKSLATQTTHSLFDTTLTFNAFVLFRPYLPLHS